MNNETVLHKLLMRASASPDRRLFTMVDGNGQDQASLTADQLCKSALSIADKLRGDLLLEAGDRAILCYPTSLEFVTALFGCLLCDVIPVPVAPPNPLSDGYDWRTFRAIAEDSRAVSILTNKEYDRARKLAGIRYLHRRGRRWPDIPWYTTDSWSETDGNTPRIDHFELDSLALLQYTSGSTSTPKGVMITHGNISHQLWLNHIELGINESSRGVFWVPHFHDFGLISGILSAVYNNMAITIMSPIDYLRRPALWFDVMSRVGATHTAAPDFAYRLAVRKTTAQQRHSWDLSSLQVVMSAAEPIRPSTVDAFIGAFSASKLNPGSFCPAYGLAEHTVGVSVLGQNRLIVDRTRLERDLLIEVMEHEDQNALTLIGCGPPSAGVDVRIIDPQNGRECDPGRMGEIWVDSPSKALGYYGQPQLSNDVFQAQVTGEESSSTYLRTGDLGFIDEGELYVAGRLKDMINAYGRNLYPQDLEETISSAHLSIRQGRTVVFSIPASGNVSPGVPREEIIALVEVKEKRPPAEKLVEIIQTVRSRILIEHQLPLRTVIVVQKGTVMKTTSGKLRRQAHRQAFLDGSLDTKALLVDEAEESSEAGLDETLQIEQPQRVAVIGGGVSGLTTAYELERLGHRVTLLERESQVGGKVTAVQVGDHQYDMGGALASDRYYGLRMLAEEIEAKFDFIDGTERVDESGKQVHSSDQYLFDSELRQAYGRVRDLEFRNISQAGIVHDAERLATPIGVWLRNNGLETLATTDIGLTFTAFGYGYLASTDIPAAYFLKYLETTGSPKVGGSGRTSVAVGSMAALWARLAGRLEDVRCNAEVTQIIRTEGGVQVTCNNESFSFDKIVLAMPFENAGVFLDASAEEATLFSQVRTLDYYTTLCSIEGLRPDRSILVNNHCLDPDSAGHILFGGSLYPETNVFIFGAYGAPSLNGDDIITLLREDLAQMGAEITVVHAQRRWRYMPHISEDDMRDGYYRRFEALQGNNRTYYVGSLLAMETIESNLAYAYELVRRHFKPTHYGVDRRLPYSHLGRSGRSSIALGTSAIKDWLVERLAAQLRIPSELIDPSLSIDAFALDSLKGMQLVSQIETELGVTLSQDWLLRGITLNDLSLQLVRLLVEKQSRTDISISPSSHHDTEVTDWEEGVL